jgi:hypothetical protein
MTDELRERIDELERRVRRLEQERGPSDGNPSHNNSDGLDRRDAAVLAELEHGRGYTSTKIQRLYRAKTDIRQEKTAKRRAKTLVQRDEFKQDGRHFIYRG